ncbi:MAG: transglutaminase-like domain-containing protein [Pseudomonadota bacterium]
MNKNRPYIAEPNTRQFPSNIDPHYMTALKALLYGIAIVLYLLPLSSTIGVLFAICMAIFASFLAPVAHRARLRLSVVLIMGTTVLILAMFFGPRLCNIDWIPQVMGVQGSLFFSDTVTFGFAAFSTVFVLRMLSLHIRAFSILEVIFIAGSAVTTFAAHRNRMFSRPRFLSDWAWSLGIDPLMVLLVIGTIAALLATILFLRKQTLIKLVTTLALLVLLSFLFLLLGKDKIAPHDATDPLGLTGKNTPGKHDSPFKDNYENPSVPQPVAVAILRNDHVPRDGMLYFRQRTLSKYDGHHLAPSQKWDRDVIIELPAAHTKISEPAQNHLHHSKLSTTMYLLVDHPQPPALTHATRITPVQNPNPTQFVAAYDVESQILSVSPRRLLGRHSVPDIWPHEKQVHYTAIPDDPRYKALSDLIVREMDPRFYHDDLAKTYAIKRFLEKEGFYTRRTTHSSQSDPTASFLFGSLHGYCVHFAHAAVFLFRSQGIASRVALGYAVQTNKRSGGSSILIMADRAHAWPEIYLENVGWITFDIYPEHTDLPPMLPVDYDLEKLLGELARSDPTAGVSPDGKPLLIPWVTICRSAMLTFMFLLVLAFAIKAYRSFAPLFRGKKAYCRLAYVSVLDRLSEVGAQRRRGETREQHAKRIAHLSPGFAELTEAHLGHALGSETPVARYHFCRIIREVRRDLRENIHPFKRFLAFFNPISWFWTR